jgi:hypothetical protein
VQTTKARLEDGRQNERQFEINVLDICQRWPDPTPADDTHESDVSERRVQDAVSPGPYVAVTGTEGVRLLRATGPNAAPKTVTNWPPAVFSVFSENCDEINTTQGVGMSTMSMGPT